MKTGLLEMCGGSSQVRFLFMTRNLNY